MTDPKIIELLEALDEWYELTAGIGDNGPMAYAQIFDNDDTVRDRIKAALVIAKPNVHPEAL